MPGHGGLVLDHTERCDKRSCGAKAWRRAYVDASRYVQFCAHHANEQPDSPWMSAFYEIDERRYILGYDEGVDS